jgi:RNA polymerase sigma-70 factor (ECF subfamily)
MHPHPSDAGIIRQVLDGEVNAYEELVKRHTPLAGRIVAGKVPREDAAEVVHEVFVRAYRSLATFDGRSPFDHWLSRIAVRSCHDYWRERYRRREVPISSLTDDTRDWLERVSIGPDGEDGPAPAESAGQYEAREMLTWLLDHLPADDRLVLTLTHLEGHSTREAAVLLGWSQSKVKVRAHRARTKLRRLVDEAGRETGENR